MSNSNYKIMFCLPGKNYSGTFLINWSNLLKHCENKRYEYYIAQAYTSNVHFVRSMCLGASILNGEDQLPFNGRIDYTHLMWIDSDIIFDSQQFEQLLSQNKNIIAGLYLMEGGTHYPVIEKWDETYFKAHGHFEFLSKKELGDRILKEPPKMLNVIYSGMGFMLIKRGVFESPKIKYLWFATDNLKIGNMTEMISEDFSFCLKAKRAGFDINIDPTIMVGHEKTQVL